MLLRLQLTALFLLGKHLATKVSILCPLVTFFILRPGGTELLQAGLKLMILLSPAPPPPPVE